MKQDKKKQIDYTKEIGISQGKQPPNSVDFERLIIGTMLIDKLGLDKVLYIYGDNPEIFYDPRHALIYDVISNLTTRKIPVDMMSVILELKKRDKARRYEGMRPRASLNAQGLISYKTSIKYRPSQGSI